MSERIYFDLETRESGDDGESNHAYAERAGVSVACVIGDDDQPTFYTEGDIQGFSLEDLADRLMECGNLVTFNGETFDLVVLSMDIGRPVPVIKSTDLKRIIFSAVREECKGQWPYPKGGMTLDSICKRTLNERKLLSDGAYAPLKWREGRYGELFSYCWKDVELTKKLYTFIRQYGYVVDPFGRVIEVNLDG